MTREELEALRKDLQWIARAGERQNELLRKYGFVFDKWPIMDGRVEGPIVLDSPYYDQVDLSKCTSEERWQAVGFTMHTRLWEIAQKAEALLAVEEGPGKETRG